MLDRCKLKEYKVPRLEYNINIKEKKKITLSFENSIKIATSNTDRKKGLIRIETKISDDNNQIEYIIHLKGIFELLNEELSDKEKENILKSDGLPVLYDKLKEIVKDIEKITNQPVPAILSLDELEEIDDEE